MQLSSKPTGTRSTSGFTLIELMVVILIISILSGIVLTAMSGSDSSREVDSGITRFKSMFSLARSAAITRKQTVRVLISLDDSNLSDPGKVQRMLRYATIVYLDDEDGNWKIYSEGQFLPEGVYFSPALSTNTAMTEPLHTWVLEIDEDLSVTQPADSSLTPAGQTSLSSNTDSIAHGAAADKWYVFEFAPNGTFRNPGARIVLVPGILQSETELLITTADGVEPTEVAKGFVVFRSGKLMHFQSGEQIKEGS